VDISKYNILDPATINYVERNAFIQKLIGSSKPVPKETEDCILAIWDDMRHGRDVRVKVDPETVKLAQDYIRYRDKGARLPKFTRWASGMFKDDKQLAGDLASAGKYEEKSSEIVISGDIIDILRCADTKHFQSCFKVKGGYEDMPKRICEQTPGIAIAYIDDDQGYMRGRVWVHHAKRIADGVDVAVVCQAWGGSLPAQQVAEAIQAKGIDAYVGGSYGSMARQADAVPVEFIDCFTAAVHHDMYTWVKPFNVTPVKKHAAKEAASNVW
jgi:hypothetical protein